MSHRDRALAHVPPGNDLAVLRAEAERRYGELQLLAAALQEHIADLQVERDRLLRQVAQYRDDTRRERAAWLHRGMKDNRSR